jgi:peroxiredoxin
MKQLTIVLIPLLLATSVFAAVDDPITLNDLAGKKTALKLGAGTPALLVFFASWCAPCKKETPHLVAYQSRAERPCPIIGICVDTQPEKGKKFVADNEVNYPVLSDPSLSLADRFGIKGTPALVLVDANGTVLHKGKKFDKKLIALLHQL